MAALTVQQVSLTGVVITAAAATATVGNAFINNGRTILRVINGGSGSTVVSIDSLVLCNQGEDHNISVTVANGATKEIGPFPMDRFNSAAGTVTPICSVVTDVTLAAISI
jgi:hypothetical protein